MVELKLCFQAPFALKLSNFRKETRNIKEKGPFITGMYRIGRDYVWGLTSRGIVSLGLHPGGLLPRSIHLLGTVSGVLYGWLYPGAYVWGAYFQGLISGGLISRGCIGRGGGLHPEVYFKGAYTSVLYPGGL